MADRPKDGEHHEWKIVAVQMLPKGWIQLIWYETYTTPTTFVAVIMQTDQHGCDRAALVGDAGEIFPTQDLPVSDEQIKISISAEAR